MKIDRSVSTTHPVLLTVMALITVTAIAAYGMFAYGDRLAVDDCDRALTSARLYITQNEPPSTADERDWATISSRLDVVAEECPAAVAANFEAGEFVPWAATAEIAAEDPEANTDVEPVESPDRG